MNNKNRNRTHFLHNLLQDASIQMLIVYSYYLTIFNLIFHEEKIGANLYFVCPTNSQPFEVRSHQMNV